MRPFGEFLKGRTAPQSPFFGGGMVSGCAATQGDLDQPTKLLAIAHAPDTIDLPIDKISGASHD
jgi:hypothetical protein